MKILPVKNTPAFGEIEGDGGYFSMRNLGKTEKEYDCELRMANYQMKFQPQAKINFKSKTYINKFTKKSLHDASTEILDELKFQKKYIDISHWRKKVNAQITENRNQMQRLQPNSQERIALETDTLKLIKAFNDIVNQKIGKNIKSDFWLYYLS